MIVLRLHWLLVIICLRSSHGEKGCNLGIGIVPLSHALDCLIRVFVLYVWMDLTA